MTYQEKLKDPRWQRKRLKILERDNWKCINCLDDTSTLHVHHIDYQGKNPWDTEDDLLEVLCDDCHSTIHTLSEKELFLYKCTVNRNKLLDDFTPETIKQLNHILKNYFKQKAP